MHEHELFLAGFFLFFLSFGLGRRQLLKFSPPVCQTQPASAADTRFIRSPNCNCVAATVTSRQSPLAGGRRRDRICIQTSSELLGSTADEKEIEKCVNRNLLAATRGAI